MWLPPCKADKRLRTLFLLLPNPRPHPDPDLCSSRSFTAQGPSGAPGPRGSAEAGAGWQDDILLVTDSDPLPQPQCGVLTYSPFSIPRRGLLSFSVWSLLLEGHKPGSIAEMSVHRGGISPSLHILPHYLPKDLRGFTRRSMSSSSISGAGSEINNKNDAQLLYRALHLQSPLLA